MNPQHNTPPFSAPTPLKANKPRQTAPAGGAVTSIVGGRRYPLRMSLIDRIEARREPALAPMDPAKQAVYASEPTHKTHLSGDTLLEPRTVEAS